MRGRRPRFLSAGILCGFRRGRGRSGDLAEQFALLDHPLGNAERFGHFAQFRQAFTFEGCYILHKRLLFQFDFQTGRSTGTMDFACKDNALF